MRLSGVRAGTWIGMDSFVSVDIIFILFSLFPILDLFNF